MRKQILFGIITAVLVVMLAGSIGGVVFGKPKHTVKTETKDFVKMEEIYVQQVRELLEEEGLSSAGVTLTYERDQDGSRHYTLLVHHHRLAGFQPEALTRLAQQMENFFFESKDCSVCAELVWQMES